MSAVVVATLFTGSTVDAATSHRPSASPADAKALQQRHIERRAVEAVIWGMPAVNFQLMLDAFTAMGGSANQVVYWSRPVNWKDQTLTPNPDTIYLTPFYDTRNGPVVLEIPPEGDGSITGSVDTGWQNPLEDVGPAGADKGKGGKYLILPPGYKDPVPDGYIALPSETYQGFALLRSNLRSGSDADIASAVAYGKRVKFYPLPKAGAAPAETRFVDAYDKPYEATIPYDARFFDALNRFVQVEPWLSRDKAMIDTLASIGIVKGTAGDALAANKAAFDKATEEAHALIESWTEQVFIPPFYAGTHWALPASPKVVEGASTTFADPNSYPVDGRAVSYSLAYFSAKHLGAGQFYLMTIKDKDGNRMGAGKTYRLHVPAHPPVQLYWSATAYDGDTHALIRDTRWSSRGSNTPGLQKNADGSVDLYFGPAALAGKESNWVPTSPHGQFEVLFRFYGPEKSFFEKAWQLPDPQILK
ncbi:DUF1254 domain-containing protein [Dyella telluris]|uniref:DUF1254 domain-containing protein n=2 Tax=Dyella telluris TaxID=2763498 RepID=A0A7G8QA47_9GAMM|nr:DUF1254 domain-containing protein [Dyella telluris]